MLNSVLKVGRFHFVPTLPGTSAEGEPTAKNQTLGPAARTSKISELKPDGRLAVYKSQGPNKGWRVAYIFDGCHRGEKTIFYHTVQIMA